MGNFSPAEQSAAFGWAAFLFFSALRWTGLTNPSLFAVLVGER
jgi:hypothetical protein